MATVVSRNVAGNFNKIYAVVKFYSRIVLKTLDVDSKVEFRRIEKAVKNSIIIIIII